MRYAKYILFLSRFRCLLSVRVRMFICPVLSNFKNSKSDIKDMCLYVLVVFLFSLDAFVFQPHLLAFSLSILFFLIGMRRLPVK